MLLITQKHSEEIIAQLNAEVDKYDVNHEICFCHRTEPSRCDHCESAKDLVKFANLFFECIRTQWKGLESGEALVKLGKEKIHKCELMQSMIETYEEQRLNPEEYVYQNLEFRFLRDLMWITNDNLRKRLRNVLEAEAKSKR